METSATCVLGIDCSTTGVKAVAFDLDGTAIAQSRRGLTRDAPNPGWAEQDAESWWTALCESLRELTARLRELNVRPLGIGIAHQRESFVLLDESGTPLAPAILWLDTRAGAQIAEFGSARVHQLSGKPASTTPSLYKLIWLREHFPALVDRAAKVVEVHGFLVHRLTGNWATSSASADPMALLDMTSGQWSPELLQPTGLNTDQLPSLALPGSVVGEVSPSAAQSTGLEPGLPVVAGAGDGQAAGLGATGLAADSAYLSLGTSLTLGLQSAGYRTSRSYRTLLSPLARNYTLEALVASGALSLSWLRRTIAQLPENADGNAELERMVRSSPVGARGLLFLPYLTSAETPYWDADARAAFVGLGEHHDRADLARATCEGLALEIRLLLEAIEADTGVHPTRIVATGGASGAGALVQIIADVLQRTVDIAAEPETAALGAAILVASALEADGGRTLKEHASRMTHVVGSFAPNPSVAASYDDLFAIYRTLYPSLRSAFSALAPFRA